MFDSLKSATNRARIAGLVGGPLLCVALLLIAPPEGMTTAAWRTAAVATWMACWWITEAIPIAATSLLPLAAFPLLRIQTMEAAAAPYANPVIFLFMGGFMIAAAFQRWDLHRRISLAIVHALGTRPVNVVAGFMIASAALSMWVSNTATAVMMLPIALSVVNLVAPIASDPGATTLRTENFQRCLMLGIAYACSIGGLGTLIGTPPNALLVGFMEATYGVRIGFAEWMLVGFPLIVVTLPITWFVLTHWLFPPGSAEIPGGRDLIARQRKELGPITGAERTIAVLVAGVALAWIIRPALATVIPGVSDAGIAMIGALLLFVLPAGSSRGGFLLDWQTASRLPWDVLILFGGGLSLAAAISQSGLAEWIGSSLGALATWPTIAVTVAVTTVVIFLTEITSNTATAATFLPVAGSVAVGMGMDPLLLTIPATIAASCAFMLPVATPPNAIVYATGKVSIPEMAKAGFVINIIFIGAITLLTYTLVITVFGI